MVNYKPYALDRTFSALADPTRRRILAALAGGGRPVTELAQPFNMSLPAVMKHLAVLEGAGLLDRRKGGRTVLCRLQAAPMKGAAEWIASYREFWEGRLDALAELLERNKEGETWSPQKSRRNRRSPSGASTRRRRTRSSARGPTRRS